MKQRTEPDPFVSVNVRAFVEAEDPYELAVVTALVFWHWCQDEEDGLGVEGIAVLGKMGTTKAKAVAAALEKKGWIERSRTFQSRTRYRLTIPKMRHAEGMAILAAKLPKDIQRLIRTDATRLNDTVATRPSISRQASNRESPGVPPNNKTPEKRESKSKRRLREYTEDFEQAWGMYDKGSKFEAFGEWNKLGTDGPDADLFLRILEAVEWQSQTEKWNEEGGKFRKDFCRWLKFRGWELKKPENFKPATVAAERKTVGGVQL